ncbi:MAG: PaaI family thioesterase [Acidimicrobiaceae bacterium]|nr:PaaI family thioesterase [Acidimicrobiaceae bacterium]
MGSIVPVTEASLRLISSYGLLGALGINLMRFEGGRLHGELALDDIHQAPNGYLHAGVVVSLADTLCGVGCQLLLPDGAVSFTTVELKTNFFSSARTGTIYGVSEMVHGGRTTQVWDCQVTSRLTNKTIAAFRCTQLIIYPKTGQ